MKAWGIVAAVLVGCFLLLWLPIALLREHNIHQRAVVAATASDHRVARRPTFWGDREVVVATLTFARPQGDGSIACRLESFEMGYPQDPDVYASAFEVAVHPHSCHEPERLPLKTLGDYFVLSVGILFSAIATFTFYALINPEGWWLAWEVARDRRRRRSGTAG